MVRESDIEQYLVDRVKNLDGEVRKVAWIGRRGAPDRLIMLPSRVLPKWDSVLRPGVVCRPIDVQLPARTIWVELKAPGVKPESHQLREHERMRDMGQVVFVIDSFDAVDELLQ